MGSRSFKLTLAIKASRKEQNLIDVLLTGRMACFLLVACFFSVNRNISTLMMQCKVGHNQYLTPVLSYGIAVTVL